MPSRAVSLNEYDGDSCSADCKLDSEPYNCRHRLVMNELATGDLICIRSSVTFRLWSALLPSAIPFLSIHLTLWMHAAIRSITPFFCTFPVVITTVQVIGLQTYNLTRLGNGYLLGQQAYTLLANVTLRTWYWLVSLKLLKHSGILICISNLIARHYILLRTCNISTVSNVNALFWVCGA